MRTRGRLMLGMTAVSLALAAGLAIPSRAAYADEVEETEAIEQVVATDGTDEQPVVSNDDSNGVPTEVQAPVVETPEVEVVAPTTDPLPEAAPESGDADPTVVDEGEPVVSDEPAAVDEPVIENAEPADDPADEPEADATVSEQPEPNEGDAANPLITTASDEEPADDDIPGPHQVIEDGIYVVGSAAADKAVLSVEGGKAVEGANVQISASNKAGTQHWEFVYKTKTDCYQILNSLGQALSLVMNKVGYDVNVVLAEPTSAKADRDAQRWRLIGDDLNGYEIVSVINEKYCLDLANGKTANGTNVRLWKRNDSKAQKFYLYSLAGADPAESAVLADGCYTIKGNGKVVEAAGGAAAKNTNTQLWGSNGTAAQKWYLTYSGGYYTITNVNSGMVLDVANAGEVPSTNVRLWTSNGTAAQRWRIDKLSDGSYSLVNKANGFVLNMAGGKNANGTNVDVHRNSGTAAQKWTISGTQLVKEGYFVIRTALNESLVFDVKGGSTANGSTVQLHSSNGTLAQKWQIKKVGNELYQIRNINSGKYLGVTDGKITQVGTATKWKAVMTKSGLALLTGSNAIDVPGGKAANNKALQTHKSNGTVAQALRFAGTPLLGNGTYVVKSALGTVLNVKDGSASSGATITALKADGTNAQAFTIKRNSDGTYTITNAISGLKVAVKGNSKSAGADVQQLSGSPASQNWKLTWDNGKFTFVNANSGLALAIAGDSTKSGANVQQAKTSGSKGQQWTLKPTTVVLLSSDKTLNSYVTNLIKSKGWSGASGLKAAYNYVSNFGYNSDRGNWVYGDWKSWTVPLAKYMYNVGAGNCYDYASLFTWIARGLGYNAKAVAGKVLTAKGWSPHGWTEVTQGGKTLMVDTEQYHWHREYNFFMVTYDDAPEYYHVGYDIN